MHLRAVLCCAIAVGTALLSNFVDSANLRGASIDCGSPSGIYQGKVSYSSTRPGARATYSCDNGCIMSGGSSSITCSSTGVWSGSPPECRVKYLKRNDNTYKNGNTGYKLYSE